jgi:hypothetical protein
MPEEQGTVADAPEETPESGPQTEAPASVEESQATEETQPEVDYRKRYEDLRPQYDRTNTELQQFRDFYGQLVNPETQAEALEAIGLQLDQEEAPDDDEYVDPEARLEEIQGWIQAQEEEREVEQFLELEAQWLDHQLSELPDAALSNTEKETVKQLAVAMRKEDGYPDVEGAYKALTDASEERQKRYIESKKGAKAPTGAAGEKPVNLNDPDARTQAAADIIEAAAQAEE